MKKIILGIGITLVLLLIIGLVALGLSLDGIVKRGVETMGPKVMKVDVKLDKFALSLFSGGGELDGLVIGNPAGFKSTNAVSVGVGRVVVKPSSLLSDKIVIQMVKVDAPEINLETGLNGTNLKKILDNLNETPSSPDTNAAAKPASAAPGKKLEVDDFLLTGAKLNVIVAGLGSQTLALPEIHLSNLGTGPDGISSVELTKVILSEIEKVAAKAAAENAGNIAKSATGLLNGLTGKTNGTAENLGKGLGDLLKKK